MSVVDLDEMKDYLKITSSTDDAKLQGFIDGAEAAIANRIGPLEPETVTATLYPSGALGTQLVLPHMNVAELTSVTPLDSAFLVLNTLTQANGVVTLVDRSYFGSLRYTVVYEAGFDPVPGDLILAVKEWVRWAWESQRGSGVRPGPALTDDGSNVMNDEPPRRVQALIGRYESVSVA